jgi:segregation and condensation protein B
MEDIKNRIEAILFTTGRFLDIEELARLCRIGSQGMLKEALDGLDRDYNNRNTSLELVRTEDKVKLNIKKDYLYLTAELLDQTEFDKATQETLALIAYRNPAMQSEIIHTRGNGAYDHIRILKEMEFVISEKSGRTRILKLTQKFYDYFDVAEEGLKEKFNQVEGEITKVENTESEDETTNTEEEKVEVVDKKDLEQESDEDFQDSNQILEESEEKDEDNQES